MDLRTSRPSMGAMKWMNKGLKERERETSGWRDSQGSGQTGLVLPDEKFRS